LRHYLTRYDLGDPTLTTNYVAQLLKLPTEVVEEFILSEDSRLESRIGRSCRDHLDHLDLRLGRSLAQRRRITIGWVVLAALAELGSSSGDSELALLEQVLDVKHQLHV